MLILFKKPETKWYLTGSLLMLISLIYFLYITFTQNEKKDQKDKNDVNNQNNKNNKNDNASQNKSKNKSHPPYALSILIISLCLISYILMTISSIYSTHYIVSVIKYLEWLITTPLLLVDLSLIINMDKEEIYTIILLDVFMILLGFTANNTSHSMTKYIFYSLSVACMIGIFYILRKSNYIPKNNKANKANLYTLFLWSVYPIVWILGLHGKKIISISQETFAYMTLDIFAKVVFAYLFIFS